MCMCIQYNIFLSNLWGKVFFMHKERIKKSGVKNFINTHLINKTIFFFFVKPSSAILISANQSTIKNKKMETKFCSPKFSQFLCFSQFLRSFFLRLSHVST